MTELFDSVAVDEPANHAVQNPNAAEVSRNAGIATGVGTYICCNKNDKFSNLLKIRSTDTSLI